MNSSIIRYIFGKKLFEDVAERPATLVPLSCRFTRGDTLYSYRCSKCGKLYEDTSYDKCIQCGVEFKK